MKRATLFAVLALSSPALAQSTPADNPAEQKPVEQKPAEQPPPAPEKPPAAPAATAGAAIDRANAAYEYGDMKEVVTAARSIVDGEVASTPAERLQALRLLGIGLYLTGRPAGAEAAFVELLRDRPKARLDPATTRPEVVAFFEAVRRRHQAEIEDAARARTRRSLVWNFLPPFGQFKNGDYGRGGVILGLEVVSAATAISSDLMLHSWCGAHNLCTGHEDSARTARTINFVSTGVLAATYVYGVIDAFVRSDHEPEGDERQLSLYVFPGGAGLGGRF